MKETKNAIVYVRVGFTRVLRAAHSVCYLAECVGNLWSQQRQNGDYNDGNQNENECVLYQALTLFSFKIHRASPPPVYE